MCKPFNIEIFPKPCIFITTPCRESRVDAVVRALPFHQCGTGSISGPVVYAEFVGSLL